MNITNAKYVEIENVVKSINATIDDIIVCVPLDPANRHFIAIQEWVAEGNTIEDAD
tara:strand:- start:18 stop:185 length:168 start_codon:yes stop_codon:yes gene_type:complete